MILEVREMVVAETDLIINYFHRAAPEYLDMLGVDPSRMLSRDAWRDHLRRQYTLPVEERSGAYVIWLADSDPVGFSTCNKIIYGERAHMHLHIIEPDSRMRGVGTECVKRSVEVYFDRLKLKTLFCEPNAFNVAPNRALQKAGFKYLKTYMTVPGPMNYHQAVTRWVIER